MVALGKAAGALVGAASPTIGKNEGGIRNSMIGLPGTTPFSGVVALPDRPDADTGKAGRRCGDRPAERAGCRGPRRHDRAAEGECCVRAGAAGSEQGRIGIPADDGHAVLADLVTSSLVLKVTGMEHPDGRSLGKKTIRQET